MKNYTKYILGFILIFIGLILGLNAFGVTDINIFFDGWWTLFIIIPSLIGVLNEDDKTSSLIFLIVGVWLLLAELDLISYGVLFKLLFPVILIAFGLILIFKDALSVNNKKIKDIIKTNGKNNDNSYIAVFGSQDLKFDEEKINGMNLKSIFGAIAVDLKEAVIDKDIVIDIVTVFGGVDIFVPDNVKVKVNSTPLFGGVDVKNKSSKDKKEHTIYINAVCIFGGVDVK